MECHTENLCSRYTYRLLYPSLGPFSAAVPVDLTSLLLIQYLPEGKYPSPRSLEGSTLGVSLLVDPFQFVDLKERGTLIAFGALGINAYKKQSIAVSLLCRIKSSIKCFLLHAQDFLHR